MHKKKAEEKEDKKEGGREGGKKGRGEERKKEGNFTVEDPHKYYLSQVNKVNTDNPKTYQQQRPLI